MQKKTVQLQLRLIKLLLESSEYSRVEEIFLEGAQFGLQCALTGGWEAERWVSARRALYEEFGGDTLPPPDGRPPPPV